MKSPYFSSLMVAAASIMLSSTTDAFSPSSSSSASVPSVPSSLKSSTKLFSSEGGIAGGAPKISQEEEDDIQWNLFLKNQARGPWRGTWTTYDFMGDILDKTQASVNLHHDTETDTVSHTHDIIVGSKSSDCETCFDSDDVRTITIGTYSKGQISKYRCASVGMVCGPSLTRSGSMSTELILAYSPDASGGGAPNSRLRVVYQHAPVWETGIEPGSCPPQGLKLYRVMVAKENLVTGLGLSDTNGNNNAFMKPVPPFTWHKKWSGTAWTWGQQTGDRGWSIEELEEVDAWHGRPTGDTADTWNLRLPGGILLQCPRVINSGIAGLCKLAWLPETSEENGGSGIDSKLLRIEASVMALEPIIDEEEEVMLGFYPPELASLRCDTFAKIGELEDTSMLEKLRNSGELDDMNADGSIAPKAEASTQPQPETPPQPKKSSVKKTTTTNEKKSTDDDSGLNAIRNALKL